MYKLLWHIHRNFCNELWQVGNELNIDDNFNNYLYQKCLEEQENLNLLFHNHDIDNAIRQLECMLRYYIPDEFLRNEFNKLLNNCYLLRREFALEEGRKIFNASAPSRLHSIFVTDNYNIDYWLQALNVNAYKLYLLRLKGKMFISSDVYFPNNDLNYEEQVEESKNYWCPKSKSLVRREYVFQGKAKIMK